MTTGFQPVGGGGGGGVTSVTASAPLASSGGATPNITLGDITGGTIVFKPGVPSADNAYETAAEIAAVLDFYLGAIEVVVDSTNAPATVPAGVKWDFRLKGVLSTGSLDSQLTVAEGGQLANLGTIRTLLVTIENTATPALTWDDYSLGPILFLNSGAVIIMASTATISPIVVPAGTAFDVFFQSGSTYIPDAGTPLLPMVELTGGGAGPGSGAVLILLMEYMTELPPPTLFSGDGTTQYGYNSDASGFPMPAWTAASTQLFPPLMIDVAAGVEYSDANVVAVPTGEPPNVQAWLDFFAVGYSAGSPAIRGVLYDWNGILGESFTVNGPYSTTLATQGGSVGSCPGGQVGQQGMIASGMQPLAYQSGMRAVAAGFLPGGLTAQAFDGVVLSGQTPGVGAGETATLTAAFDGTSTFGCQISQAYSMKLKAIATDGVDTASWDLIVSLHNSAGVTLDAAYQNGATQPTLALGVLTAVPSCSSAGATTWTLVVSPSLSAGSIDFSFIDGATTAACNVTLELSAQEVPFA